MELLKRSEVKSKYREERAESVPEYRLGELLIQRGVRPDKQYPIGKYFTDMAFPKEKIAIEYDGIIHLDNPVGDYERHIEIEKMGWRIFRLMNKGGFFIAIYENEEVFITSDFEKALELAAKFISKIYWEENLSDFSSGRMTSTGKSQKFESIKEITNGYLNKFRNETTNPSTN